MRSRRPSREEAKPIRPKSRLGLVPTLGRLAAQTAWLWVYCAARDCHHSAPLKLADVIARYAENTCSDLLRNKTRCTGLRRDRRDYSAAELGGFDHKGTRRFQSPIKVSSEACKTRSNAEKP